MPIKTYTDGIRERSGSWQLRKTVKMPDGKSIRVERTLGNKDVMTRIQASEKAIKLIQKVMEHGESGLKHYTSSFATMGHNRMSVGAIIDEYIQLGKTRGTKRTKNKPFRKGTIELLEMDKRGRWEELLHYDISTIDPEFIKDWYKKHVHDKAPATENAFRRLNTIFDYALSEGYITSNPCTMMTKSQSRYVIGQKDRRLSLLQNEIGKFALAILEHRTPQKKKLDQISLDAIVTMLFTGRRKREIFNLRWQWFSDLKDFRSFTIPAEFTSDTFEGAKTRTDYYVACSQLLQKVFQFAYLRREQTCKLLGHNGAMEFVFPSRMRADRPISDVDNRIMLISKHAGLGQLSPHDFKRTFTDVVGQSDLPDRIVKYITAHKQNDITFGRYASANETDRLQIHKGFQFVENFISQSIPFDFHDLQGKAYHYSGKKEIAPNNEEIIDRRVGNKNTFRKSYLNRLNTLPLRENAFEVPEEIKKINAEVRKTYPIKNPISLEDYMANTEKYLPHVYYEDINKMAKLTKAMEKMKDDSEEYINSQNQLQLLLVRVRPHVKKEYEIMQTIIYDAGKEHEIMTKKLKGVECEEYTKDFAMKMKAVNKQWQWIKDIYEAIQEKAPLGMPVEATHPELFGVHEDGQVAHMQNVICYDKNGNIVELDPNTPWEVDPRVVSVVNVLPEGAKPPNK